MRRAKTVFFRPWVRSLQTAIERPRLCELLFFWFRFDTSVIFSSCFSSETICSCGVVQTHFHQCFVGYRSLFESYVTDSCQSIKGVEHVPAFTCRRESSIWYEHKLFDVILYSRVWTHRVYHVCEYYSWLVKPEF